MSSLYRTRETKDRKCACDKMIDPKSKLDVCAACRDSAAMRKKLKALGKL